MTESEIAILRLRNQHLLPGTIGTAAELVRHFGAIQAQEYQPTKWGLGIRLPKLKDSDVESEINADKIVRTHLLRPTWHFVHADDLSWIQSLTSHRVQAINKYMYRKLELTDRVLNRSAAIICKAMGDNEAKTRTELADVLTKNRIDSTGFRLSYILMNAELQALICNGRRKSGQHTYTLLKNPANKPSGQNKDQSLLQLTMMYMRSRGPATVKDFSTWSGLALSDCKKGVELAGNSFERFVSSGETYYHIPIGTIPKIKNTLMLLPIYDELIMGYKDRKAIMQMKVPDQAFKFDSMILYNGQVAGTYRRTLKPKSAFFEFDFF